MTLPSDDGAAFIRAHTSVVAAPLCPSIRLHLVTPGDPLWRAGVRELRQLDLSLPFWSVCWPGGVALARWLLDHPERVRGKRVVDVGAGCGITSVAAAQAGASHVTATELDARAGDAIRVNAALNAVSVDVLLRDITAGEPPDAAVLLVGDLLYDADHAARIMAWLRTCAESGVDVLVGDPGRGPLRADGLELLHAVDVPTHPELEDADVRRACIWRVTSSAGTGAPGTVPPAAAPPR